MGAKKFVCQYFAIAPKFALAFPPNESGKACGAGVLAITHPVDGVRLAVFIVATAMFTKGQRVICINDTFPPAIAKMYAQLPVKGNTYRVRDVYLGQESPKAKDATCGITLYELRNPPDARLREIGFNSERFAPEEELPNVEIEEELVQTVQ